MPLHFETAASLSCCQHVFFLAFIPRPFLRIFWSWRWYLQLQIKGWAYLKVSSPLDLMKKMDFSGKKARKTKLNDHFLLLIFDYSPWSIALAVDFTSEYLHTEFHQCGTGSKDATFLLKISFITAPVTHKWRLYCTFSSPRLSSLSPLSSRRAVRSLHVISWPSRPSAGARLSSRFLPPQSCCYLYDPLANAPLN